MRYYCSYVSKSLRTYAVGGKQGVRLAEDTLTNCKGRDGEER